MKPNTKKRAAMKNKISKALGEDLKCLPVEMRNIFLDDLITAFENRLLVLNKAQSNLQFTMDVEMKVAQRDAQN
jgi:hypothetical protein